MNADERRNHQAVNAKMVAAALARAEPERSAHEAVCCPQCFQSAGGYHGPREAVLEQLRRVGWVLCEGSAFCSKTCLQNWNRAAERLAHEHAVELATTLPVVSMEPPKAIATGVGVRPYESRVHRTVCARCQTTHLLDQCRLEGDDWLPEEGPLLKHAGWHVEPSGLAFCSATCRMFWREPPAPPVACVEVPDQSYQRARQPPAGLALAAREMPDSGRPRRGGR